MLEKIGTVLAESYQAVGKADGVEGVSNLPCFLKLGSAIRGLGEATYLRKFRKCDSRPLASMLPRFFILQHGLDKRSLDVSYRPKIL